MSTDNSAPVGAADEHLPRWPLAYMKRESYPKGHTLFSRGDEAEKLYFIDNGSIRLVEIGKILPRGQVFGEMGMFSPYKTRTASAVCEEDVDLYTMGRDEMLHLLGQDPQLALNLMQLSIRRFMENMEAEVAARERIESELRIAARIQRNMLPQVFPPFPDRQEFEVFAMMEPALEVGGDLYDFFLIDKAKVCFLVGDVSGKGMPAALLMAICKYLIKADALRGGAVNEILEHVNSILVPESSTRMFVTLLVAILDTETGQIQMANGAHPPPLLRTRDGDVRYLDLPYDVMVGALEGASFANTVFQMNPGDLLLMYSDGVTEAMNPAHELFTSERLADCVAGAPDGSPERLIATVRDEIARFTQGAAQSDDIAMLAVTYHGRR